MALAQSSGNVWFWVVHAILFAVGAGAAWLFVGVDMRFESAGRDASGREKERCANVNRGRTLLVLALGGCAIFGFVHLWEILRDGPQLGYLWSEPDDSGEPPALYYRFDGVDHQTRLHKGRLLYDGNKIVPARVNYYADTPPHMEDGADGPPRWGYPVD